jgi:pimeloyl-ACP methyl ester carboxylesterase
MKTEERSSRRARAGASEGCRTVVVDGVACAYDDEGEGPVVVCLHAIAHGSGDYAGLRERLRGRYRVVSLDWPGHGQSADWPKPASAENYAALLPRFLDAGHAPFLETPQAFHEALAPLLAVLRERRA